jgi:hypothetical protein
MAIAKSTSPAWAHLTPAEQREAMIRSHEARQEADLEMLRLWRQTMGCIEDPPNNPLLLFLLRRMSRSVRIEFAR